MNMTIEQHLEELKKIKTQLEGMTPEFKPQYGSRQKTKTLREIAEHSNFFQIEIHPNIVDELIQRERLNRANKFVEGKLAALSASELADLQVEIQLMMINQEIEAVERRISDSVEVDVASFDPQVKLEFSDKEAQDLLDSATPVEPEFVAPTEVVSENKFTEPAPVKKGKKK